MKKLVFLLATFLSLALLLPGCEKDLNSIDPPTSPKELSYKVDPMNDTVVSGSRARITIVSNADSITSDMPGAKILLSPINKIVETDEIIQTTIYHIVFYINGKGVDIANPTIFVKKKIAPTLSVSANKSTIERGGSVLVTWVSNTDSTSSIDLPEVKGKSGSVTVAPLETTTYHFISKNDGLNISASVTITVTDPLPPTSADYIVHSPWKRVKLKWAITMDGPWEEVDLSALCLQDNRWIFYPNHNAMFDQGENLCEGETIRYWPAVWSIDEDSNIHFSGRTLISIDWESMICRYPSKMTNGETTVDIVFVEEFTH